MVINLMKYGSCNATPPTSLATCLDFVSIWGADPNRAQLGRLCAGAIVACSNLTTLPSYPATKGDPIGWGGQMLDRLLGAGVPIHQIYEDGAQCLLQMAQALPSEAEVEDTADFLAKDQQDG